MASSSILGGERIPEGVHGKGTGYLGPSDNSDSGSDAQGAYGDDELVSTSDAEGTGERATVGTGMDRSDSDILPDHIEGMSEDTESGDDADGENEVDLSDLASDDDADLESGEADIGESSVAIKAA